MKLVRRQFLEGSLFSGASLLLGCAELEPLEAPSDGGMGGGGDGGAGGGPPTSCDDALAGAALLGHAAFAVPVTLPLDEKVGTGLEGRLYTDLSELSEDTLVIDNDRFYIRTAASELLDTDDWQVRLDGLVAAPRVLTMDELLPLAVPQGVHLLECSGNSDRGGFGLMSAAAWSGVPLAEVLAMVEPRSAATRVRIGGFDTYPSVDPSSISTPGASWVFTFAELERAFLATEMNGVALPRDHGFPVRLLNPGWFGCCNIKWVNSIVFVDDDEPATSQMQEFASRTLQPGIPALARDYLPATIDQTAVPLRVEKWRRDGKLVYRVVGVMWGGYALTDRLAISIDGGPLERVTVCPAHTTNATWTLWKHLFRPSAPGTYELTLKIDDPDVPQRRLESGRYRREVVIDEV